MMRCWRTTRILCHHQNSQRYPLRFCKRCPPPAVALMARRRRSCSGQLRPMLVWLVPQTLTSLHSQVLQSKLRKNGFHDVTPIPFAHVPIIKFEHSSGVGGDVSFNKPAGLVQTEFIIQLCRANPAFPILLRYFKKWSRDHQCHGAQFGFMSSYTLSLLVIEYLQSVSPPLLPLPNIRVIRSLFTEDDDSKPPPKANKPLLEPMPAAPPTDVCFGALFLGLLQYVAHDRSSVEVLLQVSDPVTGFNAARSTLRDRVAEFEHEAAMSVKDILNGKRLRDIIDTNPPPRLKPVGQLKIQNYYLFCFFL
eukprot:c15376_g2_i3.p1 GENE.c15376_g2_i3~~c15376_g2_i3.p1  ORF type:complete len:306 (+),score=27.55 c15376_g2_i3:159-1076(+)